MFLHPNYKMFGVNKQRFANILYWENMRGDCWLCTGYLICDTKNKIVEFFFKNGKMYEYDIFT